MRHRHTGLQLRRGLRLGTAIPLRPGPASVSPVPRRGRPAAGFVAAARSSAPTLVALATLEAPLVSAVRSLSPPVVALAEALLTVCTATLLAARAALCAARAILTAARATSFAARAIMCAAWATTFPRATLAAARAALTAAAITPVLLLVSTTLRSLAATWATLTAAPIALPPPVLLLVTATLRTILAAFTAPARVVPARAGTAVPIARTLRASPVALPIARSPSPGRRTALLVGASPTAATLAARLAVRAPEAVSRLRARRTPGRGPTGVVLPGPPSGIASARSAVGVAGAVAGAAPPCGAVACLVVGWGCHAHHHSRHLGAVRTQGACRGGAAM